MPRARRFNPSSAHPARAVQAWQILVGGAMNRRLFTYEDLSTLMYGEPAAGVLNRILGHVAYYCLDRNLPPLTTIVVGKRRGSPGRLIPVEPAAMDRERLRVYRHDWYDVYPPSEDELTAAFERHAK